MSAPPPWQPTTIKSVVSEAKPTASQVVVVETDSGRGYLKAMGNSAGTHSLAVEWVATRLAAWFGLPTLTMAAVRVTNLPPIELSSEPRKLAEAGPAFITRKEEGWPWSGGEEELNLLDNPQDVARVVVFDTWVRNCDRYLPREGKEPHVNRDNLFLSEEGATAGRVILKPIDHAQCFAFATVLTPELLRAEAAVRDARLYGYFPEFKGRVSDAQVRDAVARAAALTAGEADGFFAGLPPEWEVAAELQIAWRELILGRAAFLRQDVDRICSSL